MPTFNVKLEEGDPDVEYEVNCGENTDLIDIGDYYLFFFGGTAAIQQCQSESEKVEINENNLKPRPNSIDFVSGFWRNCYKVIKTDFDLKLV